MPGMMYVPSERHGGQTNQVMNLITQLALMKVAQNFREKEAAIEATRRETEQARKEEAAAAMEGWRPAEGEEIRAPGAGAVQIGRQKMMPPVAPALTPEQSAEIGVIPTGVPGKFHFYKRDPEAEFLRQNNLLRVGSKLYQMNAKDPTKLKQVGGKDITFLRPTTNDAGDVIYPAVTETGEPSPEHDIILPKAGKTKTTVGGTSKWQKGSKTYLAPDGQTILRQDFDYNSTTTERKNIGEPYKVPRTVGNLELLLGGGVTQGQTTPAAPTAPQGPLPAEAYQPDEWTRYQQWLREQEQEQ